MRPEYYLEQMSEALQKLGKEVVRLQELANSVTGKVMPVKNCDFLSKLPNVKTYETGPMSVYVQRDCNATCKAATEALEKAMKQSRASLP